MAVLGGGAFSYGRGTPVKLLRFSKQARALGPASGQDKKELLHGPASGQKRPASGQDRPASGGWDGHERPASGKDVSFLQDGPASEQLSGRDRGGRGGREAEMEVAPLEFLVLHPGPCAFFFFFTLKTRVD